MQRYLAPQVTKDLKKKMVFVGGPRQVGKTTLAKSIVQDPKAYLNWDIPHQREKILLKEFPDVPILVLDEIHKFKRWRNLLKGLYDGRDKGNSFLITGSAKLDYYRFSGDSLQGRYHYLRMHPLSVAELQIKDQTNFKQLLALGGFPEPFFGGSEKEAKRWSREYRSRVIRDEITALEQVKDIDLLELLVLSLPSKVGNPLSLHSLQEDLQVSHKTVSRWVSILERLYVIFRILPFGAPKLRAVKKEQKHYHYDWNVIADPGSRFENFIACHLMKWVDFETDTKGRELELRYFRDDAGREVDFIVVEDGKPIQFIEVKASDAGIAKGLHYLKERFPEVGAWQIYAEGTKEYRTPEGIHVCPALKFLSDLI